MDRAIQTFKNHFISILYGADRSFPVNQCDRLLPQTVMTLNMVRQSRINPCLSAYQQIWGNYDFNRHPMVIAGCKTIVHLRPKERPCYSIHRVDGFYIEPVMDSFQNFIYNVRSTCDKRKSNIVQFFPRHTQMPETSSANQLAAVV